LLVGGELEGDGLGLGHSHRVRFHESSILQIGPQGQGYWATSTSGHRTYVLLTHGTKKEGH
jgi:hypothetical protein